MANNVDARVCQRSASGGALRAARASFAKHPGVRVISTRRTLSATPCKAWAASAGGGGTSPAEMGVCCIAKRAKHHVRIAIVADRQAVKTLNAVGVIKRNMLR